MAAQSCGMNLPKQLRVSANEIAVQREVTIAEIRKLQRRLSHLQECCRCNTLEECGEKLLDS